MICMNTSIKQVDFARFIDTLCFINCNKLKKIITVAIPFDKGDSSPFSSYMLMNTKLKVHQNRKKLKRKMHKIV